ncbi:MAG: type II secretion system GspH family protein [Candidatus Saccharibacteria bacterium]|nr:type II secretion system GspH family protein [Candidatus Saccharibacteria bacterium]
MQRRKAFTIIEVVLVLAIAGLIFLMVFIALPALQRSQRNTQREDDLARFVTAATNYQTNNKSKLPFHLENTNKIIDEKFVTRYIDSQCKPLSDNSSSDLGYSECGSEFTDPDGTIYRLKYMNDVKAAAAKQKKSEINISLPSWEESNHTLRVYTTATCGDEGVVKLSSGSHSFAMIYILEGGSASCNDNS